MSYQAYQLLPLLNHFPPEAVVFGKSQAMQALRSQVHSLAGANAPILLFGERGSGKDVIARLIHGLSPWRHGPFVKIDCSAIPGSLLETQLLACENGDFAGASGSKLERMEIANHGTLFLDEISELDLVLQDGLLRWLEDRRSYGNGTRGPKIATTRLVCATNRRLDVEISNGTLRADLYHRVNIASLRLAPLRERRIDIVSLVDYFLEYYTQKYRCQARMVSVNRLADLQKYHWPGNIRELENLIKRYAIVGREDVISNYLIARLGQEPFNPDIDVYGPISLKALTRQATRELERKVISKALQDHRWNRARAARALSISYRSLLYKIRDTGLSCDEPSCRRLKAVASQRDKGNVRVIEL